ncbi:hypothetical protein A0H81_07539 [Grifola frondosa]|uniref:Uncharacterized protein n=1 Tax=Grifola frondosa TaxID=5627 RepID=A0A1C7M6X0_GRIFR|nr:hypothetical protein A0H81_07539 [Grifola frondosa]
MTLRQVVGCILLNCWPSSDVVVCRICLRTPGMDSVQQIALCVGLLIGDVFNFNHSLRRCVHKSTVAHQSCADSRRDHNWLLRHRQIFGPLGRLAVEFSSFVQPVPDYVFAAFVVGILTTSTLCVMTVYRTLRFRNRHAMTPLLLLFLRERLYYACVTVVFLLNLFMFRFSSTLKILFSGFLDAVPCMFGARVLMSILSLVREEDRHGCRPMPIFRNSILKAVP